MLSPGSLGPRGSSGGPSCSRKSRPSAAPPAWYVRSSRGHGETCPPAGCGRAGPAVAGRATCVTVIGLLITTGVRVSEALPLAHGDVDLAARVLTSTEPQLEQSWAARERMVRADPGPLRATGLHDPRGNTICRHGGACLRHLPGAGRRPRPIPPQVIDRAARSAVVAMLMRSGGPGRGRARGHARSRQ